jgi:hypothetical protein
MRNKLATRYTYRTAMYMPVMAPRSDRYRGRGL